LGTQQIAIGSTVGKLGGLRDPPLRKKGYRKKRIGVSWGKRTLNRSLTKTERPAQIQGKGLNKMRKLRGLRSGTKKKGVKTQESREDVLAGGTTEGKGKRSSAGGMTNGRPGK